MCVIRVSSISSTYLHVFGLIYLAWSNMTVHKFNSAEKWKVKPTQSYSEHSWSSCANLSKAGEKYFTKNVYLIILGKQYVYLWY